MGCYLAIGLKIKTAIGKKEISKHLDEMPLEDIFKEIEKSITLKTFTFAKKQRIIMFTHLTKSC